MTVDFDGVIGVVGVGGGVEGLLWWYLLERMADVVGRASADVLVGSLGQWVYCRFVLLLLGEKGELWELVVIPWVADSQVRSIEQAPQLLFPLWGCN